MISYIKGELTEINDTSIVIENASGIGFHIGVPQTVIAELPPEGSEIKIYTYMSVKEDDISLFGFLNREDCTLFQLLITVNGIGPKGALAILSTIAPYDLKFAVLSDDVKAIQAAPGIGAKTAQRLIIELKDKLKLEDAFESKLAHTAVDSNGQGGAKAEAAQALIALGYARSEAVRALGQVEAADTLESGALLKEALKKLAAN